MKKRTLIPFLFQFSACLLSAAVPVTGPSLTITGNATIGGTATINATVVTGNITAGSFSGPLTGNVTGNVSGTAPAGTLTGTTLNSSVVTSSLTSVGTLTSGTWHAGILGSAYGGSGQDFSASTGFPKWASGTASVESAATHLSSIGGTTAGINIFKVPNPSAIRFLRINADNSVDALSAAAFLTAIGAGSGSGNVVGPGSSTAHALASYADTTGALLEDNSALTVSGGVLTATGFAGPLTGNVTGNVSGTAPAGSLTGTTLNSSVVTSSLTTVGTIGTGTWQATAVAPAYGGTGQDFSASTGFPKWASGTASVESAATHRTSIGGTTAGQALFTIPNPSAITFLRINADNSVDALSAAAFKTAIGAGSGTGDVVGPGSATDKAVATFDGTTGKLVQNNSGVTITSGVVTATGFAGPLTGNVTGNVSGTAPAGTLTGTTLNSSVVTSSLTSVGTLASGTLGNGASIGTVTTALGSDATGDIYYRDSGGKLARLPKATDTNVLTLASGLPSWAAAAGASFANPTASVGLTAVNGSASTAMRSDGAPALDVTIAPTWSGKHAWSSNSAASAATILVNGNPVTGGTATTNFPHMFFQPTGTTAQTNWSTSGTVIGMNLPNAYAGDMMHLQTVGNTTLFRVTAGGAGTFRGQVDATNFNGSGFLSAGNTSLIGWASGVYMKGVATNVFQIADNAQTSGVALNFATNNQLYIKNLANNADGNLKCATGVFSTASESGTFRNTAVTGTNQAGANITIAGGLGTGTGTPGNVFISSGNIGTTGTTAHGLATRGFVFAGEKTLTESTATVVLNLTLASSKYIGGTFTATTHADDGTDFQAITETFNFSAVNKAGTVTATIMGTPSTSTTASSSVSTLATTWTIVANGAGIDIKNSAISSLTQTTLAVQYQVTLNGNGVPGVTP